MPGIFKDERLTDCMAYNEWKRTAKYSAFNWGEPVLTIKTLNQHVTKVLFTDESFVLISSHKNKVNHNKLTAFTKLGEGIAVRTLWRHA